MTTKKPSQYEILKAKQDQELRQLIADRESFMQKKELRRVEGEMKQAHEDQAEADKKKREEQELVREVLGFLDPEVMKLADYDPTAFEELLQYTMEHPKQMSEILNKKTKQGILKRLQKSMDERATLIAEDRHAEAEENRRLGRPAIIGGDEVEEEEEEPPVAPAPAPIPIGSDFGALMEEMIRPFRDLYQIPEGEAPPGAAEAPPGAAAAPPPAVEGEPEPAPEGEPEQAIDAVPVPAEEEEQQEEMQIDPEEARRIEEAIPWARNSDNLKLIHAEFAKSSLASNNLQRLRDMPTFQDLMIYKLRRDPDMTYTDMNEWLKEKKGITFNLNSKNFPAVRAELNKILRRQNKPPLPPKPRQKRYRTEAQKRQVYERRMGGKIMKGGFIQALLPLIGAVAPSIIDGIMSLTKKRGSGAGQEVAKRLKAITGEIMSGNTNTQLRNEAYDLLDYSLKHGFLSKPKHKQFVSVLKLGDGV